MRRDPGRIKDTELGVRAVTDAWMNVRDGRGSSSKDEVEVDDEGVSGGVIGDLVLGVTADLSGSTFALVSVSVSVLVLTTAVGVSGGSSILVYGMKALGAWSGSKEKRGNT